MKIGLNNLSYDQNSRVLFLDIVYIISLARNMVIIMLIGYRDDVYKICVNVCIVYSYL